jgi:hypothetical protein
MKLELGRVEHAPQIHMPQPSKNELQLLLWGLRKMMKRE